MAVATARSEVSRVRAQLSSQQAAGGNAEEGAALQQQLRKAQRAIDDQRDNLALLESELAGQPEYEYHPLNRRIGSLEVQL